MKREKFANEQITAKHNEPSHGISTAQIKPTTELFVLSQAQICFMA